MEQIEMRRKDKLMTEEAIEAVLKEGEYLTLLTVGKDGYPYGTPMNYVWSDGKIYLHGTVFEGHRNKNITYSNKVSFNIVRNTSVVADGFYSKFESVIGFGIIEIVNDDKKQEALRYFIDKYSKNFVDKGMQYIADAKDKTIVYEVIPEVISGKAKY